MSDELDKLAARVRPASGPGLLPCPPAQETP
jgi:hypothetical protein